MIGPRRVLRYVVPIDDRPHSIGAGRVLMVAPKRGKRGEAVPARDVEVWVEVEVLSDGSEPIRTGSVDTLTPTSTSAVQIFGTAQLLPPTASWLGSCIDGRLVWHLYGLSQ